MEIESSSVDTFDLKHNGRNIAFDALEANRALHQVADSVTSREAAIPVDFVWRNLTFDVPIPKESGKSATPLPPPQETVQNDGVAPLKPGMKRILHGINGQVRSGQVLAIMGASGSGKTTMLNMLSGRMKSSNKCLTGGKIYINGESRNFVTFRHIAKFVEQDDTTLFAELTVREQILFSARLALSSQFTEQQKAARVEKIIQELGLAKCANTYIGSEIVRGVSGGERRRAAIGVELVADPSLIFLDEPTTGLDSFNALNVMTSLRHLARNGRTIVTTIHQPRSSIFHLFDMLCLIAEGRTVYFGPAAEAAAHFASLGFHSPPHFNVADFVIDLLSVDHRSDEKETKTTARIEYVSSHYRDNVEQSILSHSDSVYDRPQSLGQSGHIKNFSNNFLKEFFILARRTVLLMSRERQVNITRLSQTLVFGLLLGLIWLDAGRGTTQGDRMAVLGVLFFLAINQCFDAAFGIIFSYASERAIVNRERASGFYRDISYFFGKQLCEFPRAAFFNLLILAIVYFMVGLNTSSAGPFFTLLLITILLALSGEGLAQTISVFAGNEQTAAAIVPVAVIFMVLFGGFFIRPEALPGYIAWARFTSFIYYGFNAAVQNEFTGRGDGNIDAEIVAKQASELSKWGNIGVIAAWAVAFKISYFLALTANKPKFDRRL